MNKRKRLSVTNNKPLFDGNPQTLCQITLLHPVTEFPFALHRLTKHLSLIGHGWYLVTGSRPIVGDHFPKNTIRACMLLWANTLSTAALVSRGDDSLKVTAVNKECLPPLECFVPGATGWTYGEILRRASEAIMETGDYGADGRFLYKILHLGSFQLVFASRKRDVSEIPIAIVLNNVLHGVRKS